jgi:hypothetical protein
VRENKERERREDELVGKEALQIKVVWGSFHRIIWTIMDDVCIIIFFIFLGGNLEQ